METDPLVGVENLAVLAVAYVNRDYAQYYCIEPYMHDGFLVGCLTESWAIGPTFDSPTSRTTMASITDHICEPCRQILVEGLDLAANIRPGLQSTDRVLTHHANFQKFWDSANEGCHMCLQLISQRNDEERTDMARYSTPGRADVRAYPPDDKYPNIPLLWLQISYSITAEHNRIPQVEKSPDRDRAHMHLEVRKTEERDCPLSQQSGLSPFKFQCSLIKQWVSSCTEGHRLCSPKVGQPQDRPRRLLAVGSECDFSDVRIQTDVDDTMRYMTLSYCWGPQGVPIMLSESNHLALTDHLPWNALPRTIQDAVKLVRAIGEQFDVLYLWIDSLCIIQDSLKDKNEEMKRMAAIYQNSFCNLAACIGRDSQAGLFLDHDTPRAHDCVFRLRTDSSAEHGLRITIATTRITYGALVNASWLNTRGWVLQEMLLGTRVVYFTAGQLIWECLDTCFFETIPEYDQTSGIGWAQTHNSMFKAQHPETSALETPKPEGSPYHKFWHRIVKEFSARKLTFESDKLLAISAIARSVSLGIGSEDDYLVGIWKQDLYAYLLWKPERALERYDSARSPSASRPSWSWVSVDGAIDVYDWWSHFYNDGRHDMVDRSLVEIHPRIQYPSHGDCFVDPTVAEIDVTGVICRADLHVFLRSRDDNPNLEEQCEITLSRRGWHRSLELVMTKGSKCTLDRLHLDDTKKTEKGQKLDAYVLFVKWMPVYPLPTEKELGRAPTMEDYDKHFGGLVLASIDSRPGYYRRLGCFSYYDDRNEFLMDEIKKKHPLSRDEYVARSEDGEYKITII